MLSFNARSVSARNKLCDIHAFITAHDPDIILCCESWLCVDVPDSQFLPTGYVVVRKDRSFEDTGFKRGGGVFIAAKDNLNLTHVDLLDNKAEIIWGEVIVNNQRFFLASAYRSMYTNLDTDLIASLDGAGELIESYDGIFVFGDFNLEIV
jgi:hypothetical protein